MDYKDYTSSFMSSKNVSTSCGTDCDAAVVFSDTLPKAENYPVCGGDFKIPKVLSEFIVQIDSESKIKLNEPSYEIKRIEKQVFLTQCRFIPPTNKVFLEGYIRKNIEYAVKRCTKGSAIAGSIKDVTVHVPFRAYTKVDFHGCPPQIVPNLPPMVARYFDEKRMGKNIREADRSSVEIFNEPVFCELEWSAVYDADIDNKGTPIDGFMNEEEFQEFTDKSVVYLCIKLLQKQQVCLPEKDKDHDNDYDRDHDKDHDRDHCHDKEHRCKDEHETKKCPMDTEWNMPISEFTEKKL